MGYTTSIVDPRLGNENPRDGREDDVERLRSVPFVSYFIPLKGPCFIPFRGIKFVTLELR